MIVCGFHVICVMTSGVRVISSMSMTVNALH
jgi:hypothetical protein